MEIVKDGNLAKRYDFSIRCKHCSCEFNCKENDTYAKSAGFISLITLGAIESKERAVKCPFCKRETEASKIYQNPVIVPNKETKKTSAKTNDSLSGFADTIGSIMGRDDSPMWKTTTVTMKPKKQVSKKKDVK